MPRPDPGEADEVFLLGSGRSVLDLDPEEVAYINRSRCVLALNKFVLYHDVIGIVPTHIWFTEIHHPGPAILRYIVRYCRRQGLEGLTFIVIRAGGTFYDSPLAYWKDRLIQGMRRLDTWQIHLLPPRSRVEVVRLHHWLRGGEWAASLDQPLFHLRTSFTCALNYLAVKYPGSTIKLVGTDFNTPGYFFDEQIGRHNLDFSDWTTRVQAEHRTHFAVVEHEGRTVIDAFPYMRRQLDLTRNRLLCPNPESEVVLRGLASYGPIIPGRDRDLTG